MFTHFLYVSFWAVKPDIYKLDSNRRRMAAPAFRMTLLNFVFQTKTEESGSLKRSFEGNSG